MRCCRRGLRSAPNTSSPIVTADVNCCSLGVVPNLRSKAGEGSRFMTSLNVSVSNRNIIDRSRWCGLWTRAAAYISLRPWNRSLRPQLHSKPRLRREGPPAGRLLLKAVQFIGANDGGDLPAPTLDHEPVAAVGHPVHNLREPLFRFTHAQCFRHCTPPARQPTPNPVP